MLEQGSAEGVTYRPFVDADFNAVTELCARVWCAGVEGVYDRTIFGRVMTAGALRRSQCAYVAECEGVVVGACFGGICADGAARANEEWERRFSDLMVIARRRAKIGGVRVEEMLFSKLRMYTMADVFISRGYTSAEAEVNLLVVNPRLMDAGIAENLMELLVGFFCESGCHGCFTVIDDEPSRALCERSLMSCVQERAHAGGDAGGRTIWLYGRRL